MTDPKSIVGIASVGRPPETTLASLDLNQLRHRIIRLERDIADIRSGFIYPVGLVTLAVSPATSTTVTTQGCFTRSTVLLMPQNTAAATEFGAGTIRVLPEPGYFIIAHTASASARNFRWAILTPYNKP